MAPLNSQLKPAELRQLRYEDFKTFFEAEPSEVGYRVLENFVHLVSTLDLEVAQLPIVAEHARFVEQFAQYCHDARPPAA